MDENIKEGEDFLKEVTRGRERGNDIFKNKFRRRTVSMSVVGIQLVRKTLLFRFV